MASNSVRNPPMLENSTSFESWEKSLQLWQLVTDLKPTQQGPAIVLSLKGKAKDAVLELDITDIKSENGVSKVLEKLGQIYKKDTIDSAYEAFDMFINFKRNPSMTISQYVTEFERLYNKAKQHECTLSTGVLAYFLLNQANLSPDHKKLIKATISKLELNEVKTKLLKVFGTIDSSAQESSDDMKIKMEDLNIVEEMEEDVLYGGYYQKKSRDAHYNNMRGRGVITRNFRDQGYHQRTSVRGNNSPSNQEKRSNRMRCFNCGSKYHFVADCPERAYYCGQEEEEAYDVVLYQSNLVTPNDFNVFLTESSTSAILDCGASATVAGKEWFQNYFEGLDSKQQKKVEYRESNKIFRFGSNQKFKSLYQAQIPAKIGSEEVLINTDVVDSKVPLLLSKDAMKRAQTEINFVDDSVKMFGVEQDVYLTKSGHYAIPLNNSKEVLHRIYENSNVKVTLISEERKEDKRRTAIKLHAQFGHPSKIKLLKLIERAGRHDDKELLECVNEVYNQCRICKEYSRPGPRPAVGFPHALRFNETVAMDLKFFNGKIILHLIDHLTRFSAAVVCKSKEPKEIVSGIIKCWISIFGPPMKFLTDNGGEFANELFVELAESFNIKILTTAAESPWSNGLVERHNATLAEVLHKVLAENKTNFETALAWATHAKNALNNVHGFSPAQLVFGYTPQMPGIMRDSPPALDERDTQDLLSEHLNTMRAARQAFITAESSERIKRALKHNIRTSVHNKFFSGDLVYYKRTDTRKWKGPGRVIGMESSNVLIKHGSHYVRVHISRVLPEKGNNTTKLDEFDSNVSHQENEFVQTEKGQNRKYTDSSCSEDESGCEQVDRGEDSEAVCQESEASNEDTGEQVNSTNELSQMEEWENDAEESSETPTMKEQNRLKKGMNIRYQLKNGAQRKGKVIRRTGKATGIYKNCWEIENTPNNERVEYDTIKDWKWWKESIYRSEPNDIYLLDSAILDNKKKSIDEAKREEIMKWYEERVIEEIDDGNQERLSTTWVVTTKVKNDKEITKARLVVRGYEETNKSRSDSPTCIRDNVRLMLAISLAREWEIQSLDIKAAFLQGKQIDRDLFLTPPKEFRKKGKIWKLKKVVYGLSDATRSWYLRLTEVLKNLGMEEIELDKAVFKYGKSELEGMVMMHVDDLIYAGNSKFHQNVIIPLKNIFKVSREESRAFQYLGISI